jgi:beta-phosphoglucomutase-like phosphatase (HAD superfamily)
MGYQGAIFDVDGVLVDSPHELAWREALRELLDGAWRDIRDRTSWTAERFTTQVYQQLMAGKPRLAGARAALEYFEVPDVDRRRTPSRSTSSSSSSKAGLGPFLMR